MIKHLTHATIFTNFRHSTMIPLVILKVTFHAVTNLQWLCIYLGCIFDLFNFWMGKIEFVILTRIKFDIYALFIV